MKTRGYTLTYPNALAISDRLISRKGEGGQLQGVEGFKTKTKPNNPIGGVPCIMTN